MAEERVLPRDFPTPPSYLIPLSNDELRELGTFTAIWSQIDWIIMLTISRLANIELGPLQLLMENMTTGPRVGLLGKLCQRNPTSVAKRIGKLCKDNGGLIEDRNHIVHGLWAIEWHSNSPTPPIAGCLYQKGGRKHIPATKLKVLSDRAAKFSNDLGKCLDELHGDAAVRGDPPRRFFFGKQSPGHAPPPPWPPESPE